MLFDRKLDAILEQIPGTYPADWDTAYQDRAEAAQAQDETPTTRTIHRRVPWYDYDGKYYRYKTDEVPASRADEYSGYNVQTISCPECGGSMHRTDQEQGVGDCPRCGKVTIDRAPGIWI